MDVLPSWRPTATRDAIIGFVEAATVGPGALRPEERVAVFDNDGTLWTEKPMPTQLDFIVRQWAAAAAADPALADTQPYAAAATGDLAWIGRAIERHYAGDDADLRTIITAIVSSTAGMSVHDYQSEVERFYADAQHPTLQASYAAAVYQPMRELLDYLAENGFACYIVSGGDRDFMRPITQAYYGVPPERVIGSAVGLEYDAGTDDVRYGTAFDFFDDGPQKPIRIWSRIGRRPVFAAGNSNGDIPMLRFTQRNPLRLSLLIHHDDDGRQDVPFDGGAEQALASAEKEGFTVVSVRRDWETVFPS